jgi:hypothetical protein
MSIVIILSTPEKHNLTVIQRLDKEEWNTIQQRAITHPTSQIWVSSVRGDIFYMFTLSDLITQLVTYQDSDQTQFQWLEKESYLGNCDLLGAIRRSIIAQK